MEKNYRTNVQKISGVKSVFEWKNTSYIKRCCNVLFYGKKGLLMQKEMNIECLEKCIELIKKSKMVVINTNDKETNYIFNTLNKLCYMYGHYSPIVQVGESNIFFFPQLNYGDVYLVKDMVEKIFCDEKIKIIFGKTVVC